MGQAEGGKAKIIRRKCVPELCYGVVESFDPQKGWGLVRQFGSPREKLFLHKSEIDPGWVPLKGTAVKFYKGSSKGKPRACRVSRS